jgi:mono/diheme cytochrome c family protein
MPTILARKIAGDVTGIAGLVRCVASRRDGSLPRQPRVHCAREPGLRMQSFFGQPRLLRLSILFACIVATGATAGIMTAGGAAGDVDSEAARIERGRLIAERTCSLCHAVGADSLPVPALEDAGPDFRLMARKRNLTPEALAAKSGAGHGMVSGMAGTGLPAEMAEDVAAYILSLSSK